MNAISRSLQALLISAVIFTTGSALPAQATLPAGDTSPPEQPYNPIPQRLVWPGIAIIVLIGIFVTAALAGPLIRANHEDDEPDNNPD